MPPLRLTLTFCAAAMIAALAAPAGAQRAAVDLGKRNAKSRYTLGHLFALQELPDGRVVASDSKEQVFRLVDFATGDVGLVGKQGDGTDNYRAASQVLRLPGDSLGLYDPAGRKLLHVTPQGTVAAVVPLPPAILPNKQRLGTLLGTDPTGALYFNVSEQFDTATRTLSGVAGLTRVAPGATADEPQVTYRTRRADQSVNGIMPYYFRDAVAVRSDGLVARVVADTYQVIWIRNGKETGRTGPLPFTLIPISVAEQQAIKDSTVEAMKAMMAGARPGGTAGVSNGAMRIGGDAGGGQVIMISAGGGSDAAFTAGMQAGAAASAGGGAQRIVINGTDVTAAATGSAGTKVVTPGAINFAEMPLGKFPDYKPPMPGSGIVAMFDKDGNLWVARERARGDAVPHYDVIAEGKGVVARVNLPTGARLVGFGKNAVYLAREEDGSDWLERYAMPRM
jgi:hypothetical protein